MRKPVFLSPISNRNQKTSNEAGQQHQHGDAVKVVLNERELRHVRRNTNPTDLNMISDRSNSTRFKRKNQTRQIMNIIHGGEHGAFLVLLIFCKLLPQEKQWTNSSPTAKMGNFFKTHKMRSLKSLKLEMLH